MTTGKHKISLGFTSFGEDICTRCDYVIQYGDLIAYVDGKLSCGQCVNECAQYNADLIWLGE